MKKETTQVLLIICLLITISFVKCQSITNDIKIITLSPHRWQEYRSLLLEAAQNEPQALGENVDALKKEPELFWRSKLEIAQINDPMKSSWQLFAQKDNQLIGMIGAVREWQSLFYCNHIVTIEHAYVTPRSRGKGVASLLLKELLHYLEKDETVDHAILWVKIDLEAAIKVYEKQGFVKSGIMHRAVKIDGTYFDNFFMQKQIEHQLLMTIM